jgi:uncharacterized protein DUF4397
MRGKLSRIVPFAVALICLAVAFLSVGCSSSKVRYRFIQAATTIQNNVDLQVDGKTVQSAVGYGQPGSYHSASSGSRKFEIFNTGTTTNPIVSESVKLGSGDTTLILQNTDNTTTANVLSPYTDDNTAPTTGNAKLRFIHSSLNAGSVDVYVVPTGQSIAGFNPQISGLTFQQTPAPPNTYLSLSAASYDVIMTQSGTQNILNNLITNNYSLASGQIRTFVIIDSSFGGGPFQEIILNDLN